MTRLALWQVETAGAKSVGVSNHAAVSTGTRDVTYDTHAKKNSMLKHFEKDRRQQSNTVTIYGIRCGFIHKIAGIEGNRMYNHAYNHIW